MMTLTDLKSAVTSLLFSAGATGALQLNSNTRERAFEAYTFCLVLRAAQRAGAVVVVRGINSGPNPSPLVFRGAPGRLGSSSQDFAFAQCSLNGFDFEIHVDVEYEGSSGAVHEIDVSVVDHAQAERIRQRPSRLPSARSLRAVCECKFYDSTLGVALGRAFMGLIDDCGTLEFKALLTNGASAGLAQYLRQKRRPDPFFDVSPLIAASADRFVSVLEQALRRWASVA
jgi:hypothetical protein